jgi:hypothetical protein
MVQVEPSPENRVEELYRATKMVWYSQVSLIDAEDPEPWPDVGQEFRVHGGAKGVVVPAASDTDVEQIVLLGDGAPDDLLIFDGEIRVGSEGIEVGSPPLDMDRVACPPGRTRVRVYVNSPVHQESRVTFVLLHLGEE